MPKPFFIPGGAGQVSRRLAMQSVVSLAALALPSRSSVAQGLAQLYEDAAQSLSSSPLGVPLLVESSEVPGRLHGSVMALSPYPYGAVAQAVENPATWCEMLVLHLTTKTCQPHRRGTDVTLDLAIVRRHDQTLRDAFLLSLQWTLVQSGADGLEVVLQAPAGPYGSTDYVIALKAMPAGARETFIHLTCACSFGTVTRIAFQTYLATLASGKVGFSAQDPRRPDRLVKGLRGVVERNAMRYYLAIDAWLQAAPLDPVVQQVRRHGIWFDSTERFARQLHEVDRQTYLASKQSGQ